MGNGAAPRRDPLQRARARACMRRTPCAHVNARAVITACRSACPMCGSGDVTERAIYLWRLHADRTFQTTQSLLEAMP
jgi:hypothetical protein